ADHSLAARLPGTTDWRLEIDANGFRSAEQRLDLTLESELRGVGVNLPQPLAKPQSVPRLLRIRTRLDGTGLGPIRVRYPQAGSAVFTLCVRDWGVGLLAVPCGGAKDQLAQRSEARVTGTLQRLDLPNLAHLFALGSSEQTRALPPLRGVELRSGTFGWAYPS